MAVINGTTFDDRTDPATGLPVAGGGVGNLNGTAADDQINGFAGADFLSGGAGNDILDGGADNDTLDGGTGNDVLIGGTGSDSYVVDTQGDLVIEAAQGATGNNAVQQAGQIDTITTSVSYVLGAGQYVETLQTSNNGGVSLAGNELANSVIGGQGSDVIDGGVDYSTTTGGVTTYTSTIDQLTGGLGNDTFVVRGGADVIVENANEGTDTVLVTPFQVTTGGLVVDNVNNFTAYTLNDAANASVENLAAQDATSTVAIDLTGNRFSQIISGNAASNSLSGGAAGTAVGSDTLVGFGGNDTYVLGNATQAIVEADGAGADVVQINAGQFYTSGTNATLATTYTLAAGVSVETITITGANVPVAPAVATFNVTGNAFSQIINGNNDASSLVGGGGEDTLVGAGGNDTYVIDSAGDVVIEALANGTADQLQTTVSYQLGNGTNGSVLQAIESLFAGGGTATTTASDNDGSLSINGLNAATGDIFLVGNLNVANANDSGAASTLTIRGNAGANILDGNRADATGAIIGGATTMAGLGGDDTYRVYNAADIVVEDRNGGFDRVFTSASYDLSALPQTGTFNGQAYYTAVTGQAEIEFLSTASNAATTAGINLTGNGYGQIINGNNGANSISGGFGYTALGALTASGTVLGGVDVLRGFNGNDSYQVTSTNTFIFEDAGAPAGAADQATIEASASGFVLNGGSYVEALTAAAGTATINITGNELSQTITGNAGTNALSSGGGAGDTLVGLAGADSYRVFGGLDTIIEAAADAGVDSIFTSGASYQMAGAVSVEYLTASIQGAGENIFLVGNELQQTIVGNYGNNTLDGGRTLGGAAEATTAGNSDTLNGLLGSDTYRVYGDNVQADASGGFNGNFIGDTNNDGVINGVEVQVSGDVVLELGGTGGFDQVFASGNYQLRTGTEIESLSAFNQSATTGTYTLRGNGVAQSVIGNDAANTLDGRAGNDTLTGRGGNDVFAFTTALNATSNVDQITDYTAGDRIGLATDIFGGAGNFSAAIGGTLNQPAFGVGTAATTAAQRIVYNQATGQIFYDADGNGAGAAILFAQVTPNTALGFNDFISQAPVFDLGQIG